MHRWLTRAACLALLCFTPALTPLLTPTARADDPPEDEARLLRFPTVHGRALAFTRAGDLYIVSSAGGVARRLTGHDGFEMFPRFSPDGKYLAFTGQYDGNTEIYVMPSLGGEPKRLTYTATLGRDDVSDRMGPNNICMGWTPNGKYVIFRSRMDSFNDFIGQLYRVPVEGGVAEPLPLPRGGFCSFSPDGTKLAYNRVFREFRTWKRYRGGMADDVWVYDFATKKTTNLTNSPAQEVFPMWVGERIYFLSDRGKDARMNLYSATEGGADVQQHTSFADFDVKFPSTDGKTVVFEQAGYVWRYDPAEKKAERIPVRLREDRVGGRPRLHTLSRDEITSVTPGPDGTRALVGGRGEVFTVPVKDGAPRNLTNSPGVHERGARFSPDGKRVAAISDRSGEDEIWLFDASGKEKPTQLTSGADTYKYDLSWSPDGKSILWTDKKNRVQVADVAARTSRVITQSKVWEIRDAVWSPDSKWIAWSQEEANGLERVYLHGLEANATTPVSEGRHASSTPAFSGDGKYLFFVSLRDFDPIYSRTEWNHAYRDMARVYAAVLATDTPSPFRPVNPDEPKKAAPKKDDAPAPVVVKVDVEGLSERVLQLPVPAGNYRSLRSVGSSVYYIRQSSSDPKPTLAVFDLAAKKETALGQVGGYEISADGKKMLVEQGGKYGIIDLPKAPVTLGDTLDLGGLDMTLDRRAEWNQVFHESWRQMRDFFYDPGLHGVDWVKVRKTYEPLLEHVDHRADLTYIIGEMISELNAGHAYAGGGEMPKPRRLSLGLLGATVKKDPASGAFEIVSILPGSSWDPALRSPLRELGVNAKPGEFITEVDGQPTAPLANLAEALVNKAGKSVTLRLAPKGDGQGGRTVVIVPVASEAALRYEEWVEKNRKKVAEATGGKVAYVHVPDMLATGLNQFVRQFYPQTDKQALIMDVRGNGGGNVSPMLIERLRREIAMVTVARNGAPRTNPQEMIYGPMVCLLNEFSASDGDLFPYRFRQHKLGKLIGKRSWGGVIGIRGSLPLLDGSYLNRPEFSRYDVGGKEWIIEGVGVEPDIVVDNDPAREFAGQDDQLDRAIQEILAELKAKGKTVPPVPPYPKR